MPHVSYYVDAPGQWESGHTLPDLVLTHHSYVCCEVGSYTSQLLGTEQSCIGKSTRVSPKSPSVTPRESRNTRRPTPSSSPILALTRSISNQSRQVDWPSRRDGSGARKGITSKVTQ